MANLRFRIRGISENAPIYVRFTGSRSNRIELKTGYFCNPKYFNNETGKVRNVADFQEKEILRANLLDLENAITKTFNTTASYTKEWLQKEIDRHHGLLVEEKKTFTFIEIYEIFMDYKRFGTDEKVEESTLKSYNASLSRIKEFHKYKHYEYLIGEIGSDYISAFAQWAVSVARYESATYKKSITHIKTICTYAKNNKRLKVDETIFIRQPKTKLKNKSKDVKNQVLTIEEIYRIKAFNGAPYLENARDWLLISCWAGCRISDLMELTTDKIVMTINKERALHYTQTKTGHDVEAPIHPHVEEILLKNNGFPRPISHPKYNKYIKELCKQIGINEMVEGSKMCPKTNRKIVGQFPKYELISSHIGRRSFATNHYGKFSNQQIMKVTGHHTETQLLEYVCKMDTKHVTDFGVYWKKEEEQLLKQKQA
jgi:hypothetical protein